MAKLSSSQRKSLPKGEFALPGTRRFPVNDANHARNALARASQMEHEGRISKSTENKIDAAANRVLGKRKRYRMPE
jgi:hypothetical protein